MTTAIDSQTDSRREAETCSAAVAKRYLSHPGKGFQQMAYTALTFAVALCFAGCTRHPKAEPGKDLFIVSGMDTNASAHAKAVIGAILDNYDDHTPLDPLTIDYPRDGTLFPPDIVAPTMLWHEPTTNADTWLITIAFTSTAQRFYILCDGARPKPVIDPDCVTPKNTYQEDEYQAAAKGWSPSQRVWSMIKDLSIEENLTLTVMGIDMARDPAPGVLPSPVSRGNVSFRTSEDPVSAPLFYRDVPLMPSETKEGVVKPLGKDAVPLIAWRLRDISKPRSQVVMAGLPTCANCHSFSSNGRRLAMDMDGPDGDKGAHAVVPVAQHMVIRKQDVFTWNQHLGDAPNRSTSFGLFSRISPCGRYVAATVNERVFVQNYMDYRFLQTFYPTRGIIAIYDKATGRIAPLPGADDPNYVQTNPVWSPDGKELVFIRAKARDNDSGGPAATYANDPNELQIRYDLYRVSFNGGRGGSVRPVTGAAGNGKSNSFPKFSPDGKWIVFVQCKNGLLMRPDSRLYIIPARGGEAREMTCNLSLMNSWHTWSPNSRWLAFASKARRPFTQVFLTHVDKNGHDSPAVLVPNSTADNRAVNLPEFVNIASDGIQNIATPAVDYRRLMDKGRALAKRGRYGEAEPYLRDALALKPDYGQTHVLYGFVLERLGRLDAGITHFQRALDIDPSSAEAYCVWGQTLLLRGKIGDAVERLKSALAIDPQYAAAQSFWGDAMAVKGDVQAAVRHYEAALALDVECAAAHHNLASILLKQGETKDAIAHYRKAIEAEPDYTSAYNKLAWILATHPDGAIRNGVEAVALARIACQHTNYDDTQCLATLAAAHAETGVFTEAIRIVQQALLAAKGDGALVHRIESELLTNFRSKRPIRAGGRAQQSRPDGSGR